MNFKKLLLSSLIFLSVASSYALVVYGESAEEAKVDYANANAAETSVVALNTYHSAVYLGNGWFITANHTSPEAGAKISQNGNSATITSINTFLLDTYNIDLAMFYVKDVSSLTDLTAAKLSTDIYSSISTPKFYPFQTRYTDVLLVGNGKGGDGNVSLVDGYATISSTDARAIRSGTAPVSNLINVAANTYDATNYILSAAIAETGRASAQDGDSGGGMFLEYDGDYYLAGVMGIITNSILSAKYGELISSNIKINNDFTSPVSQTGALSLQNYISDIQAIIAVPEPSTYATIFAILTLTFVIYRKKKN